MNILNHEITKVLKYGPEVCADCGKNFFEDEITLVDGVTYCQHCNEQYEQEETDHA